MEKTVCFRDFEERDIDFIYKCKNDEKLNNMIVGQWHPFTYKEAVRWVHGCMGEHETYKFWAIATNDNERRIVGWVSISNINNINHSAHFHGIVIGDSYYRDGNAWIESYLFILEYVFEKLHLHRLTGSHVSKHPMTGYISLAMNFKEEGIYRDAIYKNNKYYNEIFTSILETEYFSYKEQGGYEFYNIISNIIKNKKQKKWN